MTCDRDALLRQTTLRETIDWLIANPFVPNEEVYGKREANKILDLESRPPRYRSVPAFIARQRRIAGDDEKPVEEILRDYALRRVRSMGGKQS